MSTENENGGVVDVDEQQHYEHWRLCSVMHHLQSLWQPNETNDSIEASPPPP